MYDNSNNNKLSCHGGEMEYNVSDAIGMEKDDPTQVIRVSMSTSDQDVGNFPNFSFDDEESMQESASCSKKHAQFELAEEDEYWTENVKATEKILSTSNIREKSPIKLGKLSPTKLVVLHKSMTGESLSREGIH